MVKRFSYCPAVEVGDVFTRIDRNGKVWTAEVLERTEKFVKVKKTQPYQVKVLDSGNGGKLGFWHYENPEPTIERCQLKRERKIVKTGKKKQTMWGIFDEQIEVDDDKYSIYVYEENSKYPNYKKQYFLQKAEDKYLGGN